MAQSVQIPHLNEVYSLAQFLVSDRDGAIDLVGRVFSKASPDGTGRFALLRSVVRTWGLFSPEARRDPATDADGPEESPVSSETVGGIPLVGVQAGRSVRDRLLPSVLGTLGVRDRVMVWFAAAGIGSASDLALLLETTPEQAVEWARAAEAALSRRLLQAAALHDRPLIVAAERIEPTREAVRRLLDTLLEPPPVVLSQRLASVLGLRSPERPTGRPARGRLRRVLLLTGLILAIAVVGYGIQSLKPDRTPAPRRSVDAIRKALEVADVAEPVFRTSSAEQAEIFVRDRIGWSVVAPAIQGSSITGVGLVPVLDGRNVPVFFYGNGPGYHVTVVSYTYEFLDRVEPDLTLERNVRQQISERGRFSLLDIGPRKALVFRNRDDIFVAVTPGDIEALQQAIRFPD